MSDGMSMPTQELPIVSAGASPVGGASAPGAPLTNSAGQPAPWQRPTAPRTAGWFGRLWLKLKHSPAWVAPAALLTCFLGLAATVLATNPTDDLGPTTCAFKLVTGFDCPGCGGTRAFYYVLTLNLPEAARNHAIAVFAAPFLAYLYLSWALRRVFPSVTWRLPQFRVTASMASMFLIACGGYWVIRNLPFAPFTLLYV
jgi:hypothetical protein